MFPYSELLSVLKDDLGDLTGPPCGARFVAKTLLLEGFYNKLCPTGKSEAADKAALEKFRSVLPLVPRDATRMMASPYWALFKGYMYGALSGAMGERSAFECCTQYIGLGPGANVQTDSRGFYTKLFEGPLTSTNTYLYAFYKAAIGCSALWADAEDLRSRLWGLQIVRGNTLFFVKKKIEISRTAATEPLLNQLVQTGLGGWITHEVLPRLGIKLSTQQFANRRAALDASASGKQATIDLTSASDMSSVALCKAGTIPPGILGLMMASRSERTVLPDGSELELPMIGTMGNGFTFPLETLIFACAVKAVYAHHGYRHSDGSRDYCVFGDDIIVHTELSTEVISFLGELGYLVNEGKTFTDGPFRESCGVDAWEGVNVRGVFIETLETDHHVYSAFNRLARWGATHNVGLTKTLEFLKRRVRGRLRLVPFAESDSAGIKVPSAISRPRMTQFGQRYEALCYSTPLVHVPTSEEEAADFSRRAFYVKNPVSGDPPPGQDFRSFIAEGWELSFLAGSVGSHSSGGYAMPTRAREPDLLWHPRVRFIPWWDWRPEVHPEDLFEEFWWRKPSWSQNLSPAVFDRWKTIVAYTFDQIV
jgi:hypothetical protein